MLIKIEDFQNELLIFASLSVLIIFITIVSFCCFYQRAKKKAKVHLENVSFANRNLTSFNSIKDNKTLPQTLNDFETNKSAVIYNGQTTEAPKKGFSQVFHGSPILMPKTYAAPPPPTPQTINFKLKDSKDKRCLIVTSSYCDVKKSDNDESNKDCKLDETDSINITPVLKNEKLSLKNRPSKLEIAESKVEAAISAAVSPNSLHRFSHNSSLQSSPNSIYNDNNYQKHIVYTLSRPNDIRSFNSLARLSPKLERLQENENELSYYEFEILKLKSNTSIKPRTTNAELNENIRKNRFYDILPYDFNRVKLNIEDEKKIVNRKSDYINASYITIEEFSLNYIAAQGPIGAEESRGGQRLNTVIDFWQMIWQENVNSIIALTECVENRQQKSAMYWPEYAGDTLQISSDLSVNLYCLTENETYFHRELFVYKVGEPFRQIIQWQFKNWNDLVIPQNPSILLLFLREIRSSNRKPPFLVHCGAGIGRTGVLIGLDILLEKLNRENVIDVFETVSRLRDLRTDLVQTFDEYLTIYEAIAEAIRKRELLKFK